MIRNFCRGSRQCSNCNGLLRFLDTKENATFWYCDKCKEVISIPYNDSRDTKSYEVDNSDYRSY